MKYCEDCKWMVPFSLKDDRLAKRYASCGRPRQGPPSRGVSRETDIADGKMCSTERYNARPLWLSKLFAILDGDCGPQARFFEAKP